MKKGIKILGLGLIFLSQNLLADHTTQQRSNCRVLAKYKATAKLKWPGASSYTNNSDNGCSSAQAEVRSTWDPSQTLDGQSFVHIGDDGFWAYGVANNGFTYGENTMLINPTYSFSPMIISKNNVSKNTVTNSYRGDGILFDAVNHTITFKNLTADLGVSSKDLENDFTTLQFKIFSESIKDGQSTILKTIWSAKASIINGQLLLEGDFTPNEFSLVANKKGINYNLNKTTKTLHIDESVDFETLVVEMSGDGGNLGMGITNKYAPNFSSIEGEMIKNKIIAETNFNFDITNKSKEIEISVTKNNLNRPIEEIAILSYNQEKVKSINFTLSNNKSQVINTSSLSSGAYFVRYLINGNYYMKKFII